MSKPKMLMISEKQSLQDSTKVVYDKYKNQIDYDIDFVPLAGHVVGLKMPEDYNPAWKKWDLKSLPLIPERFEYKQSKDKLRYYQEVKKRIQSGKYDYIGNNCDPGREGQLIFHAVLSTIKGKIPPIKRVWSSDPTEEEVKNALMNMRDESTLQGMTDASFLRSYMDWLVGMNFSRAVSITANQKVNLGRVMSPTLNIVVQRELELRNFVPKDFWQVEADFGDYQGILFDKTGTLTFYDEDKAKEAANKTGDTGEIISVDKKQSKSYAPRLHSLFDLQSECNELFGYTMNETLAVAQSLYEKKFLSYPRTDSSYITQSLAKGFKKMLNPLLSMPSLAKEANAVINDNALLQKVSKNKSYVDDKKVSDHYAITPTGLTPDFSKLTQDEINVYETVAKRFLAIFLPPEVTDRTTIITDSNGQTFKTNGKIIKDKGYTRLYNKRSKDIVLPNVKKGDVYKVHQVKLNKGKTKPPPRYTDKTLGSIMENVSRLVEDDEMKLILKEKKGLGTPATRGSIVEKLVSLKLIERKKKKFHATDYGISVIQTLEGHDIIQPELTATWESKLAEVEKGEVGKEDFYNEMLDYIHEQTKALQTIKPHIQGGQRRNGNNQGKSTRESIGNCPCGKGQVVVGKSYFLCEHYKNGCEFIVPKNYFGANVTKTEMKKLLAGKTTKELSMKKGSKEWKTSLVYEPNEKRIKFTSAEKSKPKTKKSTSSSVGTCPTCGGTVKETKKFYLCENYKEKCHTLIGKEINGAKITKTEAKKLLKGDWIGEKEFTWRSGKKGKAKIRYNQKIEYQFA